MAPTNISATLTPSFFSSSHARYCRDHDAALALSEPERQWSKKTRNGLNLVVDMGYRPGSVSWFRGLVTLTLLCGLAISMGLKTASNPQRMALPAAEKLKLKVQDHHSDLAALALAPLSLTYHQIRENPMTGAARVLDENIEPESKGRQIEATSGQLSTQLKRLGVSKDNRKALQSALKAAGLSSNRVLVGSDIKLIFGRRVSSTAPRPLDSIHFRPELETVVQAYRLGQDYYLRKIPVQINSEPARVEGSVKRSLYISARRLGVPPRIINQYVNLLGYSVDFQREVMGRDRFSLVYERKIAQTGETVTGRLLYASLNLSKRRKNIELALYVPPKGKPQYYHTNGSTVKRMLMRTPVRGAHMTGRFGMRRHPILGYSRMHKGVDFGARSGTAIQASGYGVVKFAGWRGSFGKTVIIDHGGGYKTLYAHMRNIRVRKGQRVSQGYKIGTVGSTGMSTGPHLHYEVHRNGRAINPNDRRIPTGRALKGRSLADYKTYLTSLRSIAPNVSVTKVISQMAPLPSLELVKREEPETSLMISQSNINSNGRVSLARMDVRQ